MRPDRRLGIVCGVLLVLLAVGVVGVDQGRVLALAQGDAASQWSLFQDLVYDASLAAVYSCH